VIVWRELPVPTALFPKSKLVALTETSVAGMKYCANAPPEQNKPNAAANNVDDKSFRIVSGCPNSAAHRASS
jgi:hypothetical protein